VRQFNIREEERNLIEEYGKGQSEPWMREGRTVTFSIHPSRVLCPFPHTIISFPLFYITCPFLWLVQLHFEIEAEVSAETFVPISQIRWPYVPEIVIFIFPVTIASSVTYLALIY
jgi:hypothetical protein